MAVKKEATAKAEKAEEAEKAEKAETAEKAEEVEEAEKAEMAKEVEKLFQLLMCHKDKISYVTNISHKPFLLSVTKLSFPWVPKNLLVTKIV